MKLNVPFFVANTDTDCGPLALKMVASFFGQDHDYPTLAALERQLKSGMVWSPGIALAARKLGFKANYVTSSITDVHTSDFYKKYANDDAMMILRELLEELGTPEIRQMALPELLSHCTPDSIPVVLLNWNVVSGKEGFFGHFVPVTGYDDNYTYVHNPGKAQAQAHMPIPRETFIKAWESQGTDKDVIVIKRF
jgi:hypothetical protein